MIIKFIQKYAEWFQVLFTKNGMNPNMAEVFNVIIIALLFFGTMYLIDQLIKKIIIGIFKIFSKKTKTTLDDYLVLSNFPKYIAHTLPVYIIWHLIPEIFKDFPLSNKVNALIFFASFISIGPGAVTILYFSTNLSDISLIKSL
jgi:miniconductance mechanosensitive channel